MSELYTSSPEGEVQEAAAAVLDLPVSAPDTPELRPLPAEPSSEEEAETESEGEVGQPLFVGPSDNVPLLNAEYLGLHRREVGCSATPTMGPARMGDLTDGEMSDLEDERSEATEDDVGDVPNEAGRFAEVVFTDQALTAMVRVPVWVLLAVLVAVVGYLCLLIGSGIIAVRQ